MLGKLLKHEFKATGRVMLPFFGVLLVLSVMVWLSINVFFFNFGGVSIIGGIVFRVGDMVYDASLRAQLDNLRESIKRGE